MTKSSSKIKYGAQILFANSSARGRRDATASSWQTAVKTVATVIPALIGESAMVSIRLKLLHRLRALDLLVEKALHYPCVVTSAVKRIVGHELRVAKERAADSEDGASSGYNQRRRRRPAVLPDNPAKTGAVGHPLTEREIKPAAEAMRDDHFT